MHPRTGWPPGMLQDDSRELSKWLANRIDSRRHAREAAQAINLKEHEMEWQPIETAPKDGTEIILRKKHRVGAAAWVHWTEEFEAAEGWTVGLDGNKWGDPTHWMPLPAAPALPSPKDVVELPLADAQMLLGWMDKTFGNDGGIDWNDEDAAACADALHFAIDAFKQMHAVTGSQQ